MEFFYWRFFCTSRNVFYVDCSFCTFLELLVGFKYIFSVAVGAALVLNEVSWWNLRIYRIIFSVLPVYSKIGYAGLCRDICNFSRIWWTFVKRDLTILSLNLLIIMVRDVYIISVQFLVTVFVCRRSSVSLPVQLPWDCWAPYCFVSLMPLILLCERYFAG